MRTLTLAVFLAVAFAGGCVSSDPSGEYLPGSSRDRITQEDLERLPPGSAFDAVQALHRDWLSSRSSTVTTNSGRTTPEIFVDGLRIGPLEYLHQIGFETIAEIRYMSPSDATTRYGTGYPGGIIEIITKKHPGNP